MKQNKTDIRPYTKAFYRGNRLPFLAALVCTLLMSLVSLMVSWLLQQLLDLMGGYQTGFTLRQLLLITLGMLAVLILALFINYLSIPSFNTRGISQYKAKIFQELTKKNICAFSAESASTYISALTNDIAAIEQGYLKNVFSLVESLLTFVGAMGLMLWYSPQLTLAAIGLTLLPLITSILTGNKMAQAEKDISRENETYTATLKDCLGGFSVIKSFQAEAQMLRLFQRDLQRLSKAQCRRQKMQILISALGSIAGIVAQLGVFLVGAYLALSGKGVTAGTTLVFVQLMNYVLSPIQTIPTCLAERKAAKALVQKAADLLGANVRENPDTEGEPLRDSIRLKDLSFSYEPEKPVLKAINCTFSLGKKYAIVGSSGSGKSTLLNLLMAAYPDYAGSITFDEKELREIGSRHLYKTVSVVQQNVFIFNATIRDNITMFSSFPQEAVDSAIRLSGLSALMEAKGEDYLCGENGCNLSGGEKQRISIARSLLKKSQVLLVDEATAALDAQTAFQISSAILDMEQTAIVITHALEEKLLRRYDRILTLKNGSITESGTFQELMDKKGYFYSLFTVSQ